MLIPSTGSLICDLPWVTTSYIVMASSRTRPAAHCWSMDPNVLWRATTAVPTFASSTFDFQSRTITPAPCLVLRMLLLLDGPFNSATLAKPTVFRFSRRRLAILRVVKHVHGTVCRNSTAGDQTQSYTSTARPWTECTA